MMNFSLNKWEKRVYLSWVAAPSLVFLSLFTWSQRIPIDSPGDAIVTGVFWVILTFGIILPSVSLTLIAWLLALIVRKNSLLILIKMIGCGLFIQWFLMIMIWSLNTGFQVSIFFRQALSMSFVYLVMFIVQVLYFAIVFGFSRMRRLSMSQVVISALSSTALLVVLSGVVFILSARNV